MPSGRWITGQKTDPANRAFVFTSSFKLEAAGDGSCDLDLAAAMVRQSSQGCCPSKVWATATAKLLLRWV